MEVVFQWQTVRTGDSCLKADFVSLSSSINTLIIENAHTAEISLDDSMLAIVYEHPNFQGRHQYIYKSQMLFMIPRIGSVEIKHKDASDYELAQLIVRDRQTNREYATYLPRGVYQDLDKSLVMLQDNQPFKMELLDDLVQIIPANEQPLAKLKLADGRVFNCYKDFSYQDVRLDAQSDIFLDAKSVLLIKLNGEYIRILQSVKNFKRLGTPVILEVHSKQPIERITVRVLNLSIADFDQLLIILMLFVAVVSILTYKMYQAFTYAEDQESPKIVTP